MTTPQETISGIIQELRRRWLMPDPCHVKHTVYHRDNGPAPLPIFSTLQELGIGALSTLHVRFPVLGGNGGSQGTVVIYSCACKKLTNSTLI